MCQSLEKEKKRKSINKITVKGLTSPWRATIKWLMDLISLQNMHLVSTVNKWENVLTSLTRGGRIRWRGLTVSVITLQPQTVTRTVGCWNEDWRRSQCTSFFHLYIQTGVLQSNSCEARRQAFLSRKLSHRWGWVSPPLWLAVKYLNKYQHLMATKFGTEVYGSKMISPNDLWLSYFPSMATSRCNFQ